MAPRRYPNTAQTWYPTITLGHSLGSRKGHRAESCALLHSAARTRLVQVHGGALRKCLGREPVELVWYEWSAAFLSIADIDDPIITDRYWPSATAAWTLGPRCPRRGGQRPTADVQPAGPCRFE